MTLNRRFGGPALAVIIAATAAPPALARPIDRPLGLQGEHGRADTQIRLVEVPAAEGFDWAGAGIGAGTMLAATGLGGALVLSIRRRHGRAASAA